MKPPLLSLAIGLVASLRWRGINDRRGQTRRLAMELLRPSEGFCMDLLSRWV